MSENQIEKRASGTKATNKNSSIEVIRNNVREIEDTNSVIAEKSKEYLDQLIVMVISEVVNCRSSIERNQKKIKDNAGIINVCKRLMNNVRSGIKSWLGRLFGKSKKIVVGDNISIVGKQELPAENRNSEQNEKNNGWILDKKAFGKRNNEGVSVKIEDIDKNSETTR